MNQASRNVIVTVAGVLGMASISHASEISVHLYGGSPASSPITGTGSAGVPAVAEPVSAWNSENAVTPLSGASSTATFSSLPDSNSALTNVSLTVGTPSVPTNKAFTNNLVVSNFGSGTADSSLFVGGINTNLANGTVPITIAGLLSTANSRAAFAPSGYDVYFYFTSSNATASYSVTDGSSTATNTGSGSSLTSYVPTSSLGTTVANYTIFHESADTVTFTLTAPASGNIDFTGLQIVPSQVPEPASIGLLSAIGAFGLMRRRRQA